MNGWLDTLTDAHLLLAVACELANFFIEHGKVSTHCLVAHHKELGVSACSIFFDSAVGEMKMNSLFKPKRIL
jgi:hypothetical protein